MAESMQEAEWGDVQAGLASRSAVGAVPSIHQLASSFFFSFLLHFIAFSRTAKMPA